MFRILDLNLFLTLILLTAAVIFSYHLLEKIIKAAAKSLKIKDGELEILISKIVLITFNILVMLMFKINIGELLILRKFNVGAIWLAAGAGFSILISILTYKLVKGNQSGGNFSGMIKGSPVFMFLTLIIFVGPAEDLLYIGIVQYTLMNKLGWLAVPVYILIFTFSHYANVLQGVESKEEFIEMLPVRLIVSFILSMAFFTTGSLIYGFIIHNIFDSMCFFGILAGTKKNQSLKKAF